MELQTIDNMMIVDYQGALINWNNSQLIKFANEIASKYKELVVTNDMQKDITKEVATLNKLVKTIEDKRKAIKKDYNTPLGIFENKVKDGVTIINNVIDGLKKQLEVFEQQRREDVTVYLHGIKCELQAKFNLQDKYLVQIQYKDNFYNVTVKNKDITQDIEQQFTILSNTQELEQIKIQQEKGRIEREAIERENKVKARYELLNKMNAEYKFNFEYDKTYHLSDADLVIAYQKKGMSILDEEIFKEQDKFKVIQERRIDVGCMTNVEKIVATNCNESIFTQPKIKNSYSLLIEGLTLQEVQEIKDLLILSNVIIKEI